MKKDIVFIVVFLIIIPFIINAQPPTNPDPVPIDGGISLLVAAAIGLGAGFLFKRKNNKKNF